MRKGLLSVSNVAIEVLDIVDAIILIMNKQGTIVFFNNAAQSMTGYSACEVENKTPWELFVPAEEIKGVEEVFHQLTAGHFPNKYSNYWITKDKGKRLLDWSNTCICDEHGQISFVIGTGIDVTEKSIAEQEVKNQIKHLEDKVSERTVDLLKANIHLESLTKTDGLTNIYNRRYFNEVINVEIERGKRTSNYLSLLMCDVDYFKNYNDAYGHLAGDDCLIKVADKIRKCFGRTTDFVARYGGEEFVVILPDIDSENALNLANRLIVEIENCKMCHKDSNVSKVVTLSIGLVTKQPDELTDCTSLIEKADIALYQAKKNGRNQVKLYSDNSTKH